MPLLPFLADFMVLFGLDRLVFISPPPLDRCHSVQEPNVAKLACGLAFSSEIPHTLLFDEIPGFNAVDAIKVQNRLPTDVA